MVDIKIFYKVHVLYGRFNNLSYMSRGGLDVNIELYGR